MNSSTLPVCMPKLVSPWYDDTIDDAEVSQLYITLYEYSLLLNII